MSRAPSMIAGKKAPSRIRPGRAVWAPAWCAAFWLLVVSPGAAAETNTPAGLETAPSSTQTPAPKPTANELTKPVNTEGATNEAKPHLDTTNAPAPDRTNPGERSDSRTRRRGDRRDRDLGSSDRGPASTSTSGSTAASNGKLDFSAFKIISERNIFSPSRRSQSEPSESRRQPRVESFSLVGTMSYDKGDFAFFDGSSSEYRKTLKADDSIAGYKVKSVAAEEVSLERDGKSLALKVGGQLRREEDGAWELRNSARLESAVAAASSGSSDSASDAGGADDILQRLLKKREQEINNEKR